MTKDVVAMEKIQTVSDVREMDITHLKSLVYINQESHKLMWLFS